MTRLRQSQSFIMLFSVHGRVWAELHPKPGPQLRAAVMPSSAVAPSPGRSPPHSATHNGIIFLHKTRGTWIEHMTVQVCLVFQAGDYRIELPKWGANGIQIVKTMFEGGKIVQPHLSNCAYDIIRYSALVCSYSGRPAPQSTLCVPVSFTGPAGWKITTCCHS